MRTLTFSAIAVLCLSAWARAEGPANAFSPNVAAERNAFPSGMAAGNAPSYPGMGYYPYPGGAMVPGAMMTGAMPGYMAYPQQPTMPSAAARPGVAPAAYPPSGAAAPTPPAQLPPTEAQTNKGSAPPTGAPPAPPGMPCYDDFLSQYAGGGSCRN